MNLTNYSSLLQAFINYRKRLLKSACFYHAYNSLVYVLHELKRNMRLYATVYGISIRLYYNQTDRFLATNILLLLLALSSVRDLFLSVLVLKNDA